MYSSPSRDQNVNIIVKLKDTKKGRLVYCRNERISKEFLDSCSALPELTHFHNESDYRKEEQRERGGGETTENRYNDTSYSSFGNDSGPLEMENLRIQIQRSGKSTLGASPEYTKSVKAVKEYESSWDNRAREAYERKAKEFEAHNTRMQQKTEKQLKDMERNNILKALEIQEATLQLQKKGKDESEKVHLKMQEDHRQHAKMLERKHEKIKEEIRRKEQEKKAREDRLKQLYTDLKTVQNRIQSIQPNCSINNKLADQCKLILERIHKNATDLENRMTQEIQSGELTPQLPEKLKDAVMFAQNAFDAISKRIEEEKRKIEEAKAKAEAEAEAKRLEEQARAAAAAAAVPLATSTPAPSSAEKNKPSLPPGVSPVAEAAGTSEQLSEGEVQCVELEAFQWYTKLQEDMKKTEESVKVLSNPECKKLKFDLQKAVNIPINAISPVSGDHLREKLKRLLDLLRGQPVEVGNKRVNASSHPQALDFCKQLTAKMIVKKGDEQVTSKHETAFAVAMVTVGLWMEHPDLGNLLLAYLHSACPYTVPYHIPRQEGQSVEEYHKSLGYRYNSDGSVEKQDQFLKRMSGMMRLYAAIIVSPPPPLRGTTSFHPHGIEHAWIWLTRVLNIHPLPDITATMIYDMLQVTGNALCASYGKQFQKLLHILIKEYLPKLKRVASASGGGPVTRLETFLETSVKNNGHIVIPTPEGFLNHNFWMSR